jgi:homoserine kinase
VTVRVPATSANLGPGFDCLGLALTLYDTVSAEVIDGDPMVTVDGEGGDTLPRDHTHLVAASLRMAAQAAGLTPPTVKLHCRNNIPQARGLGSSSAAIVAGVSLARNLAREAILDDEAALEVASDIEGHPDNVAPCLLGGFTIAWTRDGRARAVRRATAVGLAPVAYVPLERGLTAVARAQLPASVPHADAVFNVSRAALAVDAFTTDARLLLDATADRLHQPYRAPTMPASAELVEALRAKGIPAMISGAGPTVVAFTAAPPRADGFDVRVLGVADGARAV